MLRHIRWGLLLTLSLMIAVAYTSPRWLILLEPLREQEQEVARGFLCPQGFPTNVCGLLESIDRENPEEATAMIAALQSDPVPAPSNEADPVSMEEDIDREAVSEFKETLIRTGQFNEIDTLHRAQGTVNIWELVADGASTRFLRFEAGFEVSLGPNDMHVYLSINGDPKTGSEMLADNTAIDVGALKGNIGAQNYLLGGSVDVTQYRSVVIYSPLYERIFSVALLEQPIQ